MFPLKRLPKELPEFAFCQLGGLTPAELLAHFEKGREFIMDSSVRDIIAGPNFRFTPAHTHTGVRLGILPLQDFGFDEATDVDAILARTAPPSRWAVEHLPEDDSPAQICVKLGAPRLRSVLKNTGYFLMPPFEVMAPDGKSVKSIMSLSKVGAELHLSTIVCAGRVFFPDRQLIYAY